MTDKELDELSNDSDLDEDDEHLDEDLDVDEDLDLDDDLDIDGLETTEEDEESDAEPEDTESEEAAKSPRPRRRKRKGTDEEEDVLELDEELHPDDVEDPLDVLLQERTAAASLEDDEEEAVEEIEVDDRAEGPTKIRPRRAGEFLCASCFLVLPRNQLADEKRMLCRDCA